MTALTLRTSPQSAAVALLTLLPLFPAVAAESEWGSSIRAYVFARLDSAAQEASGRRDTELAVYRVTHQLHFDNDWRINTHAVLTFQSPPLTGVAGIATATAPTYLSLDGTIARGKDAALIGAFDRLNVQGSVGRARVVVGRQAITWGTNYFWPALDLFAPFAPNRIDRDYKPGVDAVRVTVPAGAFSEVEVVGAIVGEASRDDAAAGVLARFHVGRGDLGIMAGRFHGDDVVGGFLTADVQGTNLRAEISRTRSDDPLDAARDRKRFWRGSVGLDRMIGSEFLVMLEASWNGYGVDDPGRYLQELARSDRITRGEVNALGRRHVGMSVSWDVHPLWTLQNVLLVNVDDSSLLWAPAARWSTGNDSEVVFGAQLPLGSGLDGSGRARSEYGLVPKTLYTGLTAYF
jgi:hypothetical protein